MNEDPEYSDLIHPVEVTTEDGERREVFIVEVPEDISDDPAERIRLALQEAGERAITHVVPCYWQLVSVSGDIYRVARCSRVTGGRA